MPYLLLGLSVVVGLALMGRWLLDTEPKQILRVAKRVGLALLAAVALFILVRGRLDWVLLTAPLLLSFAIRWRNLLQALRNATARPSPGQSSGVRTRYLAMRLDHDSGTLDGEVLEGRFAGRVLSSLTAAERKALLDEVRDDPASLQVLEAWLERAGEAGEQHEGTGGAGAGQSRAGPEASDGTMTRARALEVLGLSEGATEEEIRESHRRLMMANHPDRGGSSWLAAQINRAKDVLLGRP